MSSRVLVPLFLLAALAPAQDRAIRLPLHPRITPDGERVVFAWQGDLWIAPLRATAPATRLTWHPGRDAHPLPSPDGEHLLFTSDRAGREQVFVMPLGGGAPRQVTFDSVGCDPLEWTADGAAFLALRTSDRSPFPTEARRLVRIPLERTTPEQVLFDAGANSGTLAPDGRHALFTRGRIQEERKGYRGAAAEQIWLADLGAAGRPALTRQSVDREAFQNVSEYAPLWLPDGSGYLFLSDPDGCFDVYRRDLASGATTRLTDLRAADGSDDGAMEPSLSKDGRRLLFRRRFDLVLLDLASGERTDIALRASGDEVADSLERRRLDSADDVAFTGDGKQIAFVAGHDLWVMDRVLREPHRVTQTLAVEESPVFSHDGKRLYFVSEADGEVDIWEASCPAREDGYWWLADSFALRKVTDDAAVETGLRASPSGDHFAYVKGGDLWVMDQDGSDHRRILASWDAPDFDWSPDGKWLCWSVQDDDFNADVWVAPIDGSRPPFNLSRHPDADRSPVWSGDGARIAWVGRRDGDEADIYFVTLTKSAAEETERDRKLREALEAMKKGRDKPARRGQGARPGADAPAEPGAGGAEPAAAAEPKDGDAKETKDGDGGPKPVRIDFDGIHERIAHVRIPDSYETSLLWSPDGETLLFEASVDGQRGCYKIVFPDELRPQKVGASLPSRARWLKEGDQVVGLSGGKPASMSPGNGRIETFAFGVQEERDWGALRQLAFDQGWRTMRDAFYDGRLNGRDWAAIRAKYRPVAAQCLGRDEFSLLMNMMLGELNASHMGHRGGSDPLPSAPRPEWSPTTWQLGLRLVAPPDGPGLLVESVIPGSPCAEARSEVRAGERVLAIDGTALSPQTDLLALLTMDQQRDIALRVRGAEGAERDVTVRPVASVQGLLYDEWIARNRAAVDAASGGRLGYLHIRGMDMSSFRQMEEDLFHAGFGKDGLIIDVRFNGGGSTADHVLTALTQPRHAITVPRDGSTGYPQDRRVYATWHKPVVVMCNEMSFSNAEIFSHAIKTLRRGAVVGMRTAGGVISTGGRGLVDGSFVRLPFRGWFLVGDGQDMELDGCLPDAALWNAPDGPDDQLTKAVEVLAAEVARQPADPDPIYRAERPRR
ncbi:MAG: PD40 domain-containing protein [Planctomycetes bacterium]|nr:PD40 domain-containing protein [Planctomycetota bacterium]